MIPGYIQRFFICRFQIKIHVLFLDALTLDTYTMIEHDLILYLSNCRTFNCCRMGNQGVQIEFIIIYLLVDSQFSVAIYELF